MLNNGDELSSNNNESDECNSTNDIELTEESIEHGRTDSEQENELTYSSSSSVPSLLSVLWAPRLLDLVRKRKTQTNNPGKCKKTRSTSSAGSDPKRLKPKDRLKKFPDEQLSVSAGKLLNYNLYSTLLIQTYGIMITIRSIKE